MQAPVLVLNTNAERDTGHKAQLGNIAAAKAVANILRTTLGPRAMLKMILDPMGGIVLTNDGNAILREIDVNHPAAKSMIELSRTQDEEVGDGTTSVIILAGEVLHVCEAFLQRRMHPRSIVTALNRALIDSEECLKALAIDLDRSKREDILGIIRSTIGTKFSARYGDLICNLALKAVEYIAEPVDEVSAAAAIKGTAAEDEKALESGEHAFGKSSYTIDIKRFCRIERIPGGSPEDSQVLDGIIINKDVLHPKMKRRIENPRILLLDCPLEYNKGESQTNIEMTKEEEFSAYLQMEEDQIRKMCDSIIALKPDIVITEKGCSELTQHFLWKAGITVFRRLRKLYNLRLAKASGATIGHRVDLLKESDIGTHCGLFEIRQIARETFGFFVQCKDPKACTIILRGGSMDVLKEMDRNLADALGVARNIMQYPKILPGGGATEMAISAYLRSRADAVEGAQQFPYRAVARALEVIPRVLITNCGKQPIRVLTELRAKHADESDKERAFWGVDGNTGAIVSMHELGVWEPFAVKMQTVKTAIESAGMLLRIDDVVSGLRSKEM